MSNHEMYRGELLRCACVLLAAGLIRFLFAIHYMSALPYSLDPINDAKMYWDFGRLIYQKGWLAMESGPFYQAPLYPYFLAILHHAGLHRIHHALLAQMLLGTINAGLCYGIARFYLSKNYAFFCGIAFSVCHLTFFFESKVLATALGLFLWLLFNVVFLKWLANQSRIWLLCSGIIFALLTLCRPNMLFTLPFVICVLALADGSVSFNFIKTNFKQCLVRASVFMLPIIVLCFAATYRNYATSGEWIFITANSGVTLYMGNNPQAQGGLAPIEGLPNDIEKQGTQSVALASALAKRELSIKEASDFWISKSVAYARENPMEWLSLEIKKLLWAFHHSPPAVNYSIHFEEEWIPWLAASRIMSGLLLAGGIAAIFFVVSFKNPLHLLLLSNLFGYALLSCVYYSSDRFLTSVIHVFCILAFMGVEKRETIIAVARWRPLLAALFALIVSFNPMFQNNAQSERAYGWYNLGVMAETGSVKVDAQDCYEEALRINPSLPDALLNLGVLYAKDNRIEESNRLLKKLIALQPTNALAIQNLAINYQRQNRDDLAQQLLERIQ